MMLVHVPCLSLFTVESFCPVVATADSYADIRTSISRLPSLSENQWIPGNLQVFSTDWDY